MKYSKLYSLIFCIVIGSIMGKFMLDQYDRGEAKEVSLSSNVYFIEQGVYSTKESMEESALNLSYYIYNEEEAKYHVYIGMTKDKNNADKLKKHFESLGNEVHIKEYTINNKGFLTVLEQYDLMLSKTEDANTISAICSQVLGKYEELNGQD